MWNAPFLLDYCKIKSRSSSLCAEQGKKTSIRQAPLKTRRADVLVVREAVPFLTAERNMSVVVRRAGWRVEGNSNSL